jgi:DNA replication protein DnaC
LGDLDMNTKTETSPFERLETFTMKHLINVYQELCKVHGDKPVNPYNYDHINTAFKLSSELKHVYTRSAIEAAHRDIISTYGDPKGRGRPRKNRALFKRADKVDRKSDNPIEITIDITEEEAPKAPKRKSMQHKHFDTLLTICETTTKDGRINVWLHGPAGSGKTTAAIKVAEKLGLKFYFNGAIQETYKLMGYKDAKGEYQTTAFREAWENGGVYLFDEIDASNPNAIVELNAALSTGLYTFPDQAEPIARHQDCVVIAGANTVGTGGNQQYNGRMKQDAAALDRFVMLEWQIDETLEMDISSNKAWCLRVQAIRTKARSQNAAATITPRATFYGEALLAKGLPQSMVEELVLKKGINDQVWQMISR